MPISKKVLRTIAVLGTASVLAGLGVFAAFSATTTNSGNNVSSGTVAIGDNDGGSTPMYVVTGAQPGVSAVKCIKVTYTGSLASAVKLYASTGITNPGNMYSLKIERGTQTTGTFPDCGNFAPDVANPIAFDGFIDTLPTGYATGIDGKDAGAAWTTSNQVTYRFTVTTNDDATPNANTASNTTGAHSFTWEARNN